MGKIQKVTKVNRSPLSLTRWCLDLACGHEVWMSATRRPKAKTADCWRCNSHIEEGTLGGAPAERDSRTGTIEQGPEVTRRSVNRAARAKKAR